MGYTLEQSSEPGVAMRKINFGGVRGLLGVHGQLGVRFASIIAGIVLLGSIASSADAQVYPSKPIRLIVPAGAGAAPDIVARLIGPKLAEALGQPIIIDNRPGAGTIIAATAAANAAPDGYSLFLTITSTLSVLPHMGANLGFDPVESFAPISRLTLTPFVLFTHAGVPATSVRELIELAKSKPGQLNFGGSSGTLPHLSGYSFMAAAGGVQMTFVPYKSVGNAIPDLASGTIQVIIETFAALRPHLQSGKVRALVTASRTRHPQLPDVPSALEAGLADFEVLAYFGLLAPKKTPIEIVDQLNVATRKILATTELREALDRLGLQAAGTTPAEFAEFIATDARRWGPPVKASGAKLE